MRWIDLVLKPRQGKSRLTPESRLRGQIAREAVIGGQLFGPVPAGGRRDFFCLDARTWIWHEGWQDASGRDVVVTTRYEIHGQQIIKIQDGRPYQVVSVEEGRNLVAAARAYLERIRRELYLPAV